MYYQEKLTEEEINNFFNNSDNRGFSQFIYDSSAKGAFFRQIENLINRDIFIIELGCGRFPLSCSIDNLNYLGCDLFHEGRKEFNTERKDMLVFLRKLEDRKGEIIALQVFDEGIFHNTSIEADKQEEFKQKYLTELKEQLERVAKNYIFIFEANEFFFNLEGFKKSKKNLFTIYQRI